MGGPGFNSTWPESKIKNEAEPKSNLCGLGRLDRRPDTRPDAMPSLGALMLLKNKTLNRVIISVVFLRCFKKFKCLGDVLDYVSLCNIEVTSFGILIMVVAYRT